MFIVVDFLGKGMEKRFCDFTGSWWGQEQEESGEGEGWREYWEMTGIGGHAGVM